MLLWPKPALAVKETWVKKVALEDALKNFSQASSIHMGQDHSPKWPAVSQEGHHIALL